MVCMVLAINSE